MSIMKNILAILSILTTMVFYGCGKKHCSDFPPEFQQQYFPYQKEQELVYLGDMGDIILLKVLEVYRTELPYNIPWNVKMDCNSFLDVAMQGNVDSTDFTLYFIVTSFRHRENNENWVPTTSDPYYLITEIDVGGYHYGIDAANPDQLTSLLDTVCLVNLDSYNNKPEPLVDTLVIVKDKGLIGFCSKEGQKYKIVK